MVALAAYPFNLMFNDEVEIKLTLYEGTTKVPGGEIILLRYDKPYHVINEFTFGDATVDFNQLWAKQESTELEYTLNPLSEFEIHYTSDGFISGI